MKDTPSIRGIGGMSREEELFSRQMAAKFINELGSQLKLTQLCMNTAIVYMHRFYMFHSFQRYHRTKIAACSLFLAAKVEEQPRKLEQLLRVWYMIRNPSRPILSPNSREYILLAEELVANENLLLQTLGFEVRAEHPHTSIITCCQQVKAAKDLTKTAYIFATNSLHLTTFCLRFKPSIVACVCIYIACKWSGRELPRLPDGKEWWTSIDSTVTHSFIDELTKEFMSIIKSTPSQIAKTCMPPTSTSTGTNHTTMGPSSGPNSVGPVSSTSSSTTSSSSLLDATSGTPSTVDQESGERPAPSAKRIRLDTT